MALDPAYQSRLVALYQWERTALGYDAALGVSIDNSGTEGTVAYTTYTAFRFFISYYSNPTWVAMNTDISNLSAYKFNNSIVTDLGTVSSSLIPEGVEPTAWLTSQYPNVVDGEYVFISYYHPAVPGDNTTVATFAPVMNDKDVAVITSATQILAVCLGQIYGDAAGCTAWDNLFNQVQGELANLQGSNLDINGGLLAIKYQAGANAVLAAGGVVPGKSDGSAVGTGCWTEKEEDYWAIDGYAPAYTNTAYISTKFSSDGAPYSTREFGFFIACKCTQHLKYGDSVTIAINGGSSASKTYQAGDTFSIPVVSATPLALSGGQDGDDTVTWKIKGMVSGALPDYQVVRDIPARYHDPATGFGFDLSIGGIPFALGDSFSLSVEGGTFAWSKNGGAASASLPMDATLIDEGMTALFTPGASPSFVVGDRFRFLAKQPGAPSQVGTPDVAGWLFLQDGASFTATFASATIDAFALAWPVGTPLLLEYSSNGVDGWVSLPPMVAGKGVYTLLLSESVVAGGIRLTMSADGGGSVGCFFAGQALATEDAPDAVTMRRVFDLVHGDKDQAALSVGAAWAGEVSWKHLPVADFNRHLTAIEYTKTTNNAPVIFIPHHQHVDEAVLVKIEADSFDITDMFQYHPNAVEHRKLSLTIPFGPVYR